MKEDFYHLTPLTLLISFMFFDRIIPSNRITRTLNVEIHSWDCLSQFIQSYLIRHKNRTVNITHGDKCT